MKLFNKKNRYSIFIIACLTFLFSTNAQALKIDNLYYIGDSLSDQGNCGVSVNFFFIHINIPAPLTNGNTYAYYLSNKLAQPTGAIPSNLRGTNYACVAGSTGIPVTGLIKDVFDLFGVRINNGLDQIKQLIQDTPVIQNNSLFVYWLGSDDILLSPPPAPLIPTPEQLIYFNPFNVDYSISNVRAGLNMLKGAGARYIVAINLSPLEKTPAALEEPTGQLAAYYKETSIAFNKALLQSLNNIGYEVIQIDLYSIYNYVVANFGKYGFTNVTNGCTTNPLPGQSCDTSFYFNDVHPTDKTHRLLADAIFSILSSPDFFASLGEVPFALLQNQNALIRQQLYPQAQNRKPGIYPFIGGTWSPSSQPGLTQDRILFNSNNTNGAVGVLGLINENFLVGAALGKFNNTTQYDFYGSNYNTNANAISLFASFQKARIYVNAIINYARLQFNDIERAFMIGPVLTVANGNTNGNQHGVAGQIGVNIVQNENFLMGPYITAEYQNLDVNGYTETGADVFNLQFQDQSNTSSIGGIGWQASMTNKLYKIPITTTGNLALNKQFNGGERPIYFRQTTFDANFASLPVQRTNGMFATAGINVGATFKHGLLVSLGYLAAFGENELQANTFLASVSIAL